MTIYLEKKDTDEIGTLICVCLLLKGDQTDLEGSYMILCAIDSYQLWNK